MASAVGEGGNFSAFSYYRVDPLAAAATGLGSSQRGAGEADAGFYAGFHRAVDRSLAPTLLRSPPTANASTPLARALTANR